MRILRLRMRNFRVLFLYEHKHVGRFSNLHWCTFKKPLKLHGIEFNPLTTNVPICSANQLTGFHMMGILVIKSLIGES